MTCIWSTADGSGMQDLSICTSHDDHDTNDIDCNTDNHVGRQDIIIQCGQYEIILHEQNDTVAV